MKLLIDAGNTRIKWALLNRDEWLRNGILPVEQAGELPQQFAGMHDIQQVWVSNVAGEEVAQHIRNIKVGQKVSQSSQLHFIVARETQCGVYNGYSNAGQLGSDRWAALIAAWHLVRGKCMVVNCGTAITIDTLSEQGKFLGGLILPGVELMQRSLVAATSQLRLEQGNYAMFPLNTADALFSGAIQACCGAIERQYVLLEDASAPVVLSGGAAGLLEKSINLPLNAVDNLVLQGLLLISQEAGAR
ncbi:MAG: type III pantothenate kinase [Gallionella sp.]